MWFSADTAVSSTNNNARHDITKKFAMVALKPHKATQPNTYCFYHHTHNKGNNKITERRTILQRESENS
jgi:hypothetical protein